MKHLRVFCGSRPLFYCLGAEEGMWVGTSGPQPQGGPPPQGLNIAGNWQFSKTSTDPGIPPATVAGSITQSGSSVSSEVHIDGSNCFDQATTVNLMGTLTGSTVSLTSISINGQIITLTGGITNNALTGTYAIKGGCADGDQGNVTGLKVPNINGTWRAIYDVNGAHDVGLATMSQDTAGVQGSFGVAGSDDSSCFAGTITPGMSPTPSFIMGTSVAIEIKASGGTIVFDGTMNQDGTGIFGQYDVFGDPCGGVVETGFACFLRDHQGTCSFP